MALIAAFLASAVASFALSLLVAACLGPDGFGRYAIAASLATALSLGLFEWLRLSTTRFAYHSADAGVRLALDRGYAAMAAVGLALAATVALGVADVLGLSSGLLVGVAGAALALGFFEYRAALARARFDDKAYLQLTLARALGGFGLAGAAAWLTREPALVLAASAAATMAAAASARSAPAVSGEAAAAPRLGPHLSTFARYGLPLVAAATAYQAIPLLNASVLAARSGFAEAGYFSLGGEIGMRLLQNLGFALDLALFQLAVRAERRGRADAERQLGRNLATVTALILPSGLGLWLVWPSFEVVFLPAAFHGRTASAVGPLLAGLVAFTLGQYALGPYFQLRRRTLPVVVAALAALALDIGLLLAPLDLDTPAELASAQAAAFGAGLLALGGSALAAGARLPWRDLVGACAAAGAMAAALTPWREAAPGSAILMAQVAAGAAVYGSVAVALDVAGARTWLAARRGPRPMA